MKTLCQPGGFIQQLLSWSDIGSERWWNDVIDIGTPILEEKPGQQAEVLFLWRDSQGNEQQSTTCQVLIDINGITDHHSYQPESLSRIKGTDVWYWSTLLDKNWHGSYSLIPIPSEDLPFDFENAQQQRQWWCSVYAKAIADPLNKLKIYTHKPSLSFSALHMPYATKQIAWHRILQSASSPFLLNWHSQQLGNDRRIWLYQTGIQDIGSEMNCASIKQSPDSSRPLIIFLDGQIWAESMPIFAALDMLTKQNQLPAAIWLFVDVINSTFRQQELPCNRQFWLAVQSELLPLIRHYVQFSDKPEHTVIVGQSYGGLSALYAGLFWPERFGCVVSQSGSFWWPHTEMVNSVTPPDNIKIGWLTQQVIKQGKCKHPLKIYQEAGRYEPDILYVNEQIKIALERAGHCVNYHVFNGGHDVLCWRGGLIEGLCWVLSDNQ